MMIKRYYTIIKADYLQRFRSYTFMITLLLSVVLAYSFVPAENANYTTVRVGHYIGLNNAAWIGHVTAIMASTFLWLIGFYIINNGIRRDTETGVGQIIATTSITNFQYLLSKSLSNFLILLTITVIIIMMALGLIITRGSNYYFDIGQFIFPYLFATIPSILFLSVLAVAFEVAFNKKTNLLNVVFFFVFAAIVAMTNTNNNSNLSWFDPLGIKFLTSEMSSFVNKYFLEKNLSISSVGFTFNKASAIKYFLYPGSNFNLVYISSRLFWLLMAFLLLKVTAVFFKRFETKFISQVKNKTISLPDNVNQLYLSEPKASGLIKTETNFGIYALIKTEFILLLRKGPKWFWFVNAGLFIALIFMPLDIALKIGIPIFWFLQINRWADLSTKEKFFGTDTFIYSTYKPLQRLLMSQVLAGILLATLLALPVIIKLILHLQILVALEVVLGAIILVTFSICSGIIWTGKRFFEISLFIITYGVVEGLEFLDYWGGFHSGLRYIMMQILVVIIFLSFSFFIRQYSIKK